LVSLILLATSRAAPTTRYVDVNSTNPAQCVSSSRESIPWSEIGAKAGTDYHGDGLSVTAVPQSGSARLRCAFQGLEGEATTNGLWLRSTVTNAPRDPFRVAASSVGRAAPCAQEPGEAFEYGAHGVSHPSAVLPNAAS